MNKTIKVIAILMMAIMLCTLTTSVFASNPTDILNQLKDDIDTADVNDSTKDISVTAGKVIKLIRNVSIILAVVLITVLGIKYMMGSAEEKSGYQKSFIPLIVGIVVVVSATSIASMLFGVV